MEDTPKLTQIYAQEELESQLLADFFSGRKFDGEQLVQWNRMREGLFLSPVGRFTTPKKSADSVRQGVRHAA
jgi:hypothetical protein